MKANIESGITSNPAKTLQVPFYVPIFNPLIHCLLRLGVPMGPMALITIRGRKTGKAHTNPVAPFERNGHHYLLSPYGRVNWVRNLHAAGEATLRHGWHKKTVVAVELVAEEAAPVLREAIIQYLPTRMGAMILRPNFNVEVDSPLTDFIAEAKRHPVFELRETPST